jgi:hypothetical protein
MATVRLTGISGVYVGSDFPLPAGENVIGRAPEMPISLVRDETVSRRHAVISVGPTGVTIRDLESRNGVHVNGARVRTAALAPGATVQIGSTVFRMDPVDRPVEREPAGLESMIAGFGDVSDPRWLAALGYIGNLVGIPLFFFPLGSAAKARAALPHQRPAARGSDITIATAAPGVTAPGDPQVHVIQFLEFHGRQARGLFLVELILGILLAPPAIALVLLPLILGSRGLGTLGAVIAIGVIGALGVYFGWMNLLAYSHARNGGIWAAPLWSWLQRRL